MGTSGVKGPRGLFPRDDADQFEVGMEVLVFDDGEAAMVVPSSRRRYYIV